MAEPEEVAVARRSWWPPSRRTMAWGAGAVIVIGATLLLVARELTNGAEDEPKLPPRGHLVCPAASGTTPAPTASLRLGDFAILVIADRDDTFQELVWGQVLSRSPEGDQFLVRLLGRTGETGAVDLAKYKHGFRIGNEIKIDADCVWDTMHAPDVDGKGQLYCGFAGEELIDEPPVLIEDLREGDEVKVVVSTIIGSEAHADALWTRVDGISRTGNVVYGTIVSPIQFPMHGFRQWQEIEFGRDCIFGGRRP